MIDALIRKGILSDQEAEEARADLMKGSQQIPALAHAGGKSTSTISVGGRLQVQYAGLNTSINGKPDPAITNTNRFSQHRVYLTTKANMGVDWSLAVTCDFAGPSYDAACSGWKHVSDTAADFGLRKVNVGYEEFTSSGSLKAIECSGVTRCFAEGDNGRRLRRRQQINGKIISS
ncbi:MAG: hypothetical protein PHQ04_07455 [Opitutaceae bacterium]|nr:hypothetical protein [Opitutaceae bacterium]